jgi:hypothetical protein
LQYIPNLITVEFLLFIKSQFTTNDPSVLNRIISRLNTSDRGLSSRLKGPGEVASDLTGIKNGFTNLGVGSFLASSFQCLC